MVIDLYEDGSMNKWMIQMNTLCQI